MRESFIELTQRLFTDDPEGKILDELLMDAEAHDTMTPEQGIAYFYAVAASLSRWLIETEKTKMIRRFTK
jgi:hypothetical protein